MVTLGAQGSHIYTNGARIEIPCVKPEDVVDPTGCGDAYRAGLLYGIAAGLEWSITGRLASLLGAVKIARRGGQNHQFTRDEIAQRYRGELRRPALVATLLLRSSGKVQYRAPSITSKPDGKSGLARTLPSPLGERGWG